MRIGDRRAHVAHDGERIRPRQSGRVSYAQHTAERCAVQQFHRKERDVAVAVEFVHPNDVRMRQQLQVLELALKFDQDFLAPRDGGMQNLEGQPLTGGSKCQAIFVGRFEYGAHAAVADHCTHPVAVAQHVADRHLARRTTCRFAACGGCRFADCAGRRFAERRACDRCYFPLARRAGALARSHVFIDHERRAFEAGFERLKELCPDFSAAVVLVQQGQDFPAFLAVALELIAHGAQERFRSAGAARQGVQPGKSRALTAGARLRPSGRLGSSAHVDILSRTPHKNTRSFTY